MCCFKLSSKPLSDKMMSRIRIMDHHYPDLKYDSNGVRKTPLFWDFVGKVVWFVDEQNPIYTIDMSAGFSFRIDKTTAANYAHIKSKHMGEPYGDKWLYFKERNDANRFIKKVKKFIEDNAFESHRTK